MKNILNCFRCDCPLTFAGNPNAHDACSRNQPNDGLYFRTFGNYGSTFFDPMRDTAYLEIAICDGCMRARKEQILPSPGALGDYE